jgi:hypothetical protein
MLERYTLADLRETKEWLALSVASLKTHGHEQSTWDLYWSDLRRVREIRALVAADFGDIGAPPGASNDNRDG